MTKKPKNKQASMFDALAKKTIKNSQPTEPEALSQNIESQVESKNDLTEDEVSKPEKQPRKRAKTGKRSDPAYTQVGCYLPRDLNNRVKVKLVGDHRDFSDLTAELLEKWLSE